MLVYPPAPTYPFPVPATVVKPLSDLVFNEELIVPAGRGTDAALKSSYNPDYTSGIFVNNSQNTFWLLALPYDSVAPSKDTVIDSGLRVNQNGSSYVLPENLIADIYLATSSTNDVAVRCFYWGSAV